MITLNWEQFDGEIGAMMKRFNELPRYIAKKHLKAAMRRAMRPGVPVLKRHTPVGKSQKIGDKTRRGGDLRRAATTKVAYKGSNRDGYVYGVLGYKYGSESRKAIWLEFGTKNGIQPRQMVGRTMAAWGGPAAEALAKELAAAFEKAVKEVAAGINPGGAAGFRRRS
jgi:hypothetical protein